MIQFVKCEYFMLSKNTFSSLGIIFGDVLANIWNNKYIVERTKFSIDFPSRVKSELKQSRSEILF